MPARIPRELVVAERQLLALAAAIDVPLHRVASEERVLAVGLGLRGWALYRGFRHALSGPTPLLVAHVDLRTLLDVTILARWIEDDPNLRVKLWFADDRREQLLGEDLMRQYLERRELPQSPPPADWNPADADAEIQEARAAGRAAGIPLPRSGRRALPQIEQMVQAVPNLWEIYHVAYRHLSPVQHAGGRSFVKDAVERRDDGRHLKPGAPFDSGALRALAVPAVCMLFASPRPCSTGQPSAWTPFSAAKGYEQGYGPIERPLRHRREGRFVLGSVVGATGFEPATS